MRLHSFEILPASRAASKRSLLRYAVTSSSLTFCVITRIAVVIETMLIRAGDADPRDIAEAFVWARENRAELRLRWQEYSEEEPLPTPRPFASQA